MNAALALISNPRAAAEVVSDCLIDTWGPMKGTTKIVADIANCNERSAENWTQKKVCPGVPSFLRLAMATPQLREAVMWLMTHGPEHPQARKRIAAMEAFLRVQPEAGDRYNGIDEEE